MSKKFIQVNDCLEKNLEISKIQEKLFRIPFPPVFEGEIGEYLYALSARHSVCKEFLFCPLFTGISHLLRFSQISTLTTLCEKSVFYSSLVANPSTGKSTAMSIVKKFLYEIEEYSKIPRKKSNLINAGTVEALLTNLESNPSMVSFFDESSTFMSSFGLYKGGDGKYDRSVYLELYTGPDGYDRTLTSNRFYIDRPRFSVCLLGHMSDYIDFVRQEKKSRDDGLIQRFHICAPKPVYFKCEDMVKIPPVNYSLTVLLFIISKLNETPINYLLDEKATIYFHNIYDIFKTYAEKFGNKYDLFMAAMCGKTASQILRVAMFIHSFKKAYSILKHLESMNQLNLNIHRINSKLESAILSIARHPNKFNVVSEETLIKAESLVNYFNKNKICFAEYEDVDYSLNFPEIMDNLEKKTLKHPKIQKKYNQKFRDLIKKILFFPSDETFTFKINDLNQSLSNNYKKENIIEAATELQILGLGTLTEEKQTGTLKKPHILFTKINQIQIKNNIDAISNLENIGINPSDYINCLSGSIDAKNGKKNKKSL